MESTYWESTYYSMAIAGGTHLDLWSAAMCVVALWLWYKTRILGALVASVGFAFVSVAIAANKHIPTAYSEGSGTPILDAQVLEPAHVQLHMFIGTVALIGFAIALGGFLALCMNVARRLPATASSSGNPQ